MSNFISSASDNQDEYWKYIFKVLIFSYRLCLIHKSRW